MACACVAATVIGAWLALRPEHFIPRYELHSGLIEQKDDNQPILPIGTLSFKQELIDYLHRKNETLELYYQDKVELYQQPIPPQLEWQHRLLVGRASFIRSNQQDEEDVAQGLRAAGMSNCEHIALIIANSINQVYGAIATNQFYRIETLFDYKFVERV